MLPRDLWQLFNLRDTLYFATAQEAGKLAALEKEESVQNTRQLVRVFRETTGFSGGVGVPLIGSLSAGRSASLNTPGVVRPSILVAPLLQGLMRVARELPSAHGILVHVNNLENLSEADATKASAIFRDLRDPCLLADGYHWLVVGTGDALSAAIDTHPQLRSVFSLTDLQPFLQNRYEADARARLTGTQVKALAALAARVKEGSFLIKDAASIWRNERSRASRLVAELQRAGYVLPLDRVAGEERGRPATAYALSGSARLAFPSDA